MNNIMLRLKGKILTTKQAAQYMGIPIDTVTELCRTGQMKGAKKVKGLWHIPVETARLWKQNQQSEIDAPRRWESFRNQPWIFWPSTIIGIILGFLSILGILVSTGADSGSALQQFRDWGLVQSFPVRQENEILIVIATFYTSAGNRNTEIHDQLRDAINEQIVKMNLSNIRVEVDPTVLKANQRSEAEKLGQRYDSTCIIWGADTGLRIQVNFLDNSKVSELGNVSYTETAHTQLISPEKYAEFILDGLTPEIAFLSLLTIGKTYQFHLNFQKSAAILENALELLPPDPSNEIQSGLDFVYSNLATSYLLNGEFDSAIANSSKAINLNPENVLAYNNRGLAYSQQGNLTQGIADFTKAIDINPKFGFSYGNRGTAYYFQGNVADAIVDYTTAIEIDPEFPFNYFARGNALYDQGNFSQAITDYSQALQSDSLDLLSKRFVYVSRANAYREQGDIAQAISDYTQVIQIDPQNASAYAERATAYSDQGNFAQAVTDYIYAIKLDNKNPILYSNRGSAYYYQGKFDQAIADYTQAIRLDPSLAEVFYCRGNAYAAQDNYGQSLTDYNQAILLDPTYPPAYYGRAMLYARNNEVAKALGDLKHYLLLSPNAWNRLAVEQKIKDLETR